MTNKADYYRVSVLMQNNPKFTASAIAAITDLPVTTVSRMMWAYNAIHNKITLSKYKHSSYYSNHIWKMVQSFTGIDERDLPSAPCHCPDYMERYLASKSRKYKAELVDSNKTVSVDNSKDNITAKLLEVIKSLNSIQSELTKIYIDSIQ